MCAAGLHTVLPLLAATLLLCCSYPPAQLSGAAGCLATRMICCVATPGRVLFLKSGCCKDTNTPACFALSLPWMPEAHAG